MANPWDQRVAASKAALDAINGAVGSIERPKTPVPGTLTREQVQQRFEQVAMPVVRAGRFDVLVQWIKDVAPPTVDAEREAVRLTKQFGQQGER